MALTCPVCEHVQEAPGACEVCGRELQRAPAPPAAPPEDTSAWLEPTAAERAEGATPAGGLDDLEPTRIDPRWVTAAPGEPVPELERTGLGAPIEPAPPTDAVPDLEPTAVVLRPGPRRIARDPPGDPRLRGAEASSWRCGSCGFRTDLDRCPECGARPPDEER